MKKERSKVKVRMRGGVMRRSRQKEKIEKKNWSGAETRSGRLPV